MTSYVGRFQGRKSTSFLSAEEEQQQRLLEVKRLVHERILKQTEFTVLDNLSPEELTAHVQGLVGGIAAEAGIPLSTGARQRAEAEVVDEITGYGPIQRFLDDPTVTEVMVNGHDMVFVERKGRLEETTARFLSDDHLMRIIHKIVTPLGRRVDGSSPMVDARLPDGSRVNVLVPPLAVDGPHLTIRKFSQSPFTPEDLVSFGTMSQEISDFLKACIVGKLNIIISGGTGSGKTTTLNALSSHIPGDERIITIEDAAELKLQQRHVITTESRPANLEGQGEITIRQLVRNSLRMRPDRIIVGEVRGAEALDMLQAMNTGHQGSMGTVHANSTQDVLSRLETMVLMAGTELPSRAIREQIASAIDLIVHQARFRDGVRRIVQISEVQRMEGDVIALTDLFAFEQDRITEEGCVEGRHESTGLRPLFAERLAAQGIPFPISFVRESGASKW
ncbi:MAG: CpaF family protein [Armatimonadia bacterium]